MGFFEKNLENSQIRSVPNFFWNASQIVFLEIVFPPCFCVLLAKIRKKLKLEKMEIMKKEYFEKRNGCHPSKRHL